MHAAVSRAVADRPWYHLWPTAPVLAEWWLRNNQADHAAVVIGYLDACRGWHRSSRIADSLTGRGRESLTTDADLRDAALYRLQTLAESTQHLSPELKTAHPDIPWEDIADFRNRIVHGYLGVSLDIVWDIIQRDLPPLANLAREGINLHCEARKSRAKNRSRSRTRPFKLRGRWRANSCSSVGGATTSLAPPPSRSPLVNPIWPPDLLLYPNWFAQSSRVERTRDPDHNGIPGVAGGRVDASRPPTAPS